MFSFQWVKGLPRRNGAPKKRGPRSPKKMAPAFFNSLTPNEANKAAKIIFSK